MHSGPKINTGDLVFGYDTGLNINSNIELNEKSRRFYKGKPTNNRLISEANWLHIGTEITNPKTYPVSLPKGVKFHKGAYNTAISWTDACRNYTDSYAAGTKITVSGWHMFYTTDTSLTMNARTRLGWHYSKDGASTYGGTIYTATEWNKWYYFSSTFSSTGTTTQLRVEDGGYDYYLSADDAAKTTQYYCNLQIEVGTDVASPYSNGTRSNTGGLIDLRKSVDIDLDNVSFKSNGQPEFDGTNDYISINEAASSIASSDFSLEVIMKGGTQDHKGLICINTSSGGNRALYMVRNASAGIYDGGTWYIGNIDIDDNNWHHVILTYNRTSKKAIIYVDNKVSLNTTTTNQITVASNDRISIGQEWDTNSTSDHFNGEIPVAKIYDKALTANEVKQNFSSYRKRFNL